MRTGPGQWLWWDCGRAGQCESNYLRYFHKEEWGLLSKAQQNKILKACQDDRNAMKHHIGALGQESGDGTDMGGAGGRNMAADGTVTPPGAAAGLAFGGRAEARCNKKEEMTPWPGSYVVDCRCCWILL